MQASHIDTDTIVIGAGVIGLAIARAVTRTGRDCVVLERNAQAGAETSSRNSEVVHAGLYYPPGSLRAQMCVRGNRLLYDFAAQNGVPIKRCGKLVVATSDHDIEGLKRIAETARGNGVDDLEWLSSAHARALEPHLKCLAALYSPSTGIVDAHSLMVALEGHLASGGTEGPNTGSRNAPRIGHGEVVLNTHVVAITQDVDATFAVETKNKRSGNDETSDVGTLRAQHVINAAGLWASKIGRMVMNGQPGTARKDYQVPQTYFGKGHYYRLKAPAPFQRLIYPVPDGAWLGVHATLDLAGAVRVGPDLQWVDRIDYSFDDPDGKRRCAFAKSIQRYWPDLREDQLAPDSTGVRPKLYRQGEAATDFAIHGSDVHGIRGYVGLYGIESPGLTSALAIGEYVAAML